MPVCKVYGILPEESGEIPSARKALKEAISRILGTKLSTVSTYFPSDMDPDSLEGDVVLDITSKMFPDLSEETKDALTKETNSILKKFFPSTENYKRVLWETFLITAKAYGMS